MGAPKRVSRVVARKIWDLGSYGSLRKLWVHDGTKIYMGDPKEKNGVWVKE